MKSMKIFTLLSLLACAIGQTYSMQNPFTQIPNMYQRAQHYIALRTLAQKHDLPLERLVEVLRENGFDTTNISEEAVAFLTKNIEKIPFLHAIQNGVFDAYRTDAISGLAVNVPGKPYAGPSMADMCEPYRRVTGFPVAVDELPSYVSSQQHAVEGLLSLPYEGSNTYPLNGFLEYAEPTMENLSLYSLDRLPAGVERTSKLDNFKSGIVGAYKQTKKGLQRAANAVVGSSVLVPVHSAYKNVRACLQNRWNYINRPQVPAVVSQWTLEAESYLKARLFLLSTQYPQIAEYYPQLIQYLEEHPQIGTATKIATFIGICCAAKKVHNAYYAGGKQPKKDAIAVSAVMKQSEQVSVATGSSAPTKVEVQATAPVRLEVVARRPNGVSPEIAQAHMETALQLFDEQSVDSSVLDVSTKSSEEGQAATTLDEQACARQALEEKFQQVEARRQAHRIELERLVQEHAEKQQRLESEKQAEDFAEAKACEAERQEAEEENKREQLRRDEELAERLAQEEQTARERARQEQIKLDAELAEKLLQEQRQQQLEEQQARAEYARLQAAVQEELRLSEEREKAREEQMRLDEAYARQLEEQQRVEQQAQRLAAEQQREVERARLAQPQKVRLSDQERCAAIERRCNEMHRQGIPIADERWITDSVLMSLRPQ